MWSIALSHRLKQMCWLNGRNHPKNEPLINGPEHAEKEDSEEESEGAASIALSFNCTVHDEAIVSTLNAMSDEMRYTDVCIKDNKTDVINFIYLSHELLSLRPFYNFSTFRTFSNSSSGRYKKVNYWVQSS